MKITKALVSEHSLARTKFLATGKTLGNKTHVFCPVILCLAARRISCRQIKVTELSKIISDHSRLQVARRLARKHSHHFFRGISDAVFTVLLSNTGQHGGQRNVVELRSQRPAVVCFSGVEADVDCTTFRFATSSAALTNGSCLGSSL